MLTIRWLLGCGLAAFAAVSLAQTPAANLVVTNARVIDGTGRTLERASIVVRDGRIVSVSEGAAQSVPGALVIDAGGRTALPGYIDAHRHIIQGGAEEWLANRAEQSMREFLEAGFTTVLSAGDPEQAVLELRRRTAAGELRGPRIIAAARAPLSAAPGGGGGVDPARTDVSRPPLRPTTTAPAVPAERTRTRVAEIAAGGFDAVKTVIITTPDGPEIGTLRLIGEETTRHGLKSITHAVTVIDTLAAVEAGTDLLVHTPHIGMLTEQEAKRIADSGIPMLSTLGIFVPFFDEEDRPIFRDALPFPWETISSAGQGPVNARLLWEAGVLYAFGTDTRFHPRETLKQELKSLFLVFSERDVLRIMTRNTAAAIGMLDSLGTLEPGKLADIVLVDGDPEKRLFDLLEVALVIKEGTVVVDKR